MTHAEACVTNYDCVFDTDTVVGSLHKRNGKEGKGTTFSFLVATLWSICSFQNKWLFFSNFFEGEKILLRCNLKQSTRSSQRILNMNKNISSMLIIMLCLLCQLMIHYPKQLVHYKWFCIVFMELQTVKGKNGFTFLATVCFSVHWKTEL